MTDNTESVKPPKPMQRLSVAKVLLWTLLLWSVVGAIGVGIRWKEITKTYHVPKLSVPVIVIESDDWGSGTIWGSDVVSGHDRDMDVRQSLAVNRLAKILKRHQDSRRRHPIVSTFIVVGQADVSAILADSEHAYHWQPIDRAMPRTVTALRKAEAEGVFALEYHARDHKNANSWTTALLKVADKARRQGRRLSPTDLGDWVDKSEREKDVIGAEYFDVRNDNLVPASQQDVSAKVEQGLAVFERVFGRRSLSTAAPRHLWGPCAAEAWRANGLRFVHGANYQRGPNVRLDDVWSRKLGARLVGGLVGVHRNIGLEMNRMNGSIPSVETVLSLAHKAFAGGQPAVISTHSYHYYPEDAARGEAMFQRLNDVLTAIEHEYPDLIYLSAEEIGQLGERGRVSLPSVNGKTVEIVAVDGLRHAWLSAVCLYHDHAKLRLWFWGMVVLTLFAGTAFVVRRLRGLACKRSRSSAA